MKEKHSNIQDAIYRNLQENETYAYEILVENKTDYILIVPRTNNTEAFNENMKSSIDIASQNGGTIKVVIYRGKSPKAGLVAEYKIVLDDNSKAENTVSSQSQIEQAVENAMQKYQLSNNNGLMGNIENINLLLGALTGNDTDNENKGNSLNGLAGLLGAVNNSRYENTFMKFEKKISDYKQETQITSLQKELKKTTSERDALKKINQELEKQNYSYKSEISDLENRLEGYTSTELLKRMATGVISGIGSKILGNSPKAAELLGLTKDELQAALGFVEENDGLAGNNSNTDANVEIEEIPTPKNDQQKKVFQAIDDIAKALKKGDTNFAFYMINIIANCLDSKELTKSIMLHMNHEIERLGLNVEADNTEPDESE